MNAARHEHTLTLLLDGRVLAVGGMDSRPLASAEVYSKTAVQIAWSDLVQIYDGTPRSVHVTTIPAGVPVEVTYDGGGQPPVNAGSYEVVATVRDPSFTGSGTNTFTIIPALAPVMIRTVAVSSGGVCSLHFGSAPGISLFVVAADELPLVGRQWTVLRPAVETPAGSGQYQFTDPAPATSRQRFYQVRTRP